MSRFDLKGPITPQMLISAANFIAIIFCGGMIWSATTGDIRKNKEDQVISRQEFKADISQIRNEMLQLRTQDRDIAVLKTDVLYIKDSVARIERNVAPIPMVPPR